MPDERSVCATRTECRACLGKALHPFLDLGTSPLANSFLRREDLAKPEAFYPLRVFVCENCFLSQLVDIVRPDVLFRDYIYFSSGVRTVPEHFRTYAEEIAANFATSKNDLVVELGSNDGVLIGAVQALGPRVVGVDPALNVAKIANERGIRTIPEFFNAELAERIRAEHGPAKVIVGNNVIAHIDGLQDVVSGIASLLADDGVFMFEAPYLKDMFDHLTFDTVYHEHVSYLSVRPMQKLLGRFGLEIFDVKTFPVQGISLRTYAGKKGKHPVLPSVGEFIAEEKRLGMDTTQSYDNLGGDVAVLKRRVLGTLRDLKSKGKKLAGYGAPAKGNTLLNYFGIGTDILDYVTEELPSKIGLYTPGMHIPVVHVDDARRSPPDAYLLLAWNSKDAILKNEKRFLEGGGTFIMPVGRKTEIISRLS